MPLYECVFIARQDISASQVDTMSESFTAIISDNGGAVAKKEYWGLKTLSYRIKKNRKGHYVMFNVDAPAAAVHELERNMRLNEDVLRYLTIRVDELEEGPSAMMQAKSSRDGGRRGDRDRDRRGPRDRDGGGRDEGRGRERDRDDNRGPRGDRDAAPAEVASEGAAS